MTEKKKCTKLVLDLESHIQNNKLIKKLQAENSRLHNLIRDAYLEAFDKGYKQGIDHKKANFMVIDFGPEHFFQKFKESRVDKKKS